MNSDKHILAIDIGATKTAFGLFAGDEQPVHYHDVHTPAENWDDFREMIEVNAHQICARTNSIEHIGVSVGGMVSPKDQTVACANIRSVNGRKLGRDLQQILQRPVFLRNDAECLALAESMFGVGKGHRQVFTIILGSGIGGAISVDGNLLAGATGNMGEWGHGNLLDEWVEKFSLTSRICGCGRRNCLDLFGAGLGISNIHFDLFGAKESAQQILAAWHANSDQAVQTVEVFLTMVSEQLALAINVIDPDIVPVAGGLSNDRALIEQIDARVRARIIGKSDDNLVVPAAQNEIGCLLGASLLDANNTNL